MKSSIYLIGLLLVLAVPQNINAKTKQHYLVMIGMLQQDLNNDWTSLNLLNNAEVSIVSRNTKQTTFTYSDSTGQILFKLPLNDFFTIHISKKGFITKTITVNTGVPANKITDYTLLFDVFLFEKIDAINVTVLNNPIAKVTFNGYYDCFIYNYSYTDMVNRKLKKMYASYYSKHGAHADTVHRTIAMPMQETAIAMDTTHSVEAVDPSIEFHIQLLATSTPRTLTNHFFEGFVEVVETKTNDFFKYTVGNFRSLSQAQALKVALRNMGYKDAFIVVDKDAQRIPVQEALAELKR